MTASTEQERAEFEAAWMQSTTATKPPKRYEDGDYHSPAAGEAWRWWQAARRAPVVAVPHEADFESQPWGYGVPADAPATKYYAAAPQPPEVDHIPDAGKMVAAPVQLLECAGKTIAEPEDFDDGCCLSWRGGMPPPRGTNLYTEQQVRQLLAAHGIKAAP